MIGALSLSQTQPVAHAILVISMVAVAGLALGSIRFRGIALGSAGVVFTGILVGHLGARVDPHTLAFVKEFGLVLFVFTIGLQLGPRFGDALREHGMRLNLLAATTVILGALVAVGGAMVLRIDYAAAVGLFSGATTNTPSLGAAQQAMSAMPNVSPAQAALPALAYAVAYPAGVAGIVASLLVLRSIFRIDPAREAEQFAAEQRGKVAPLERMTLVVENAQLDDLPLRELPGCKETGVVISRIRHGRDGKTTIARDDMPLHTGDRLLAIGTRHGLEQFSRIIGRRSNEDLTTSEGNVTARRMVVTRETALGRSLRELGLRQHYDVTVTRVTRGDLEMVATPDLELRFGDVVQVVGEPDNVAAAGKLLGDSVKRLGETQFIALFIGLALGVMLGLIPIAIPGMSAPVRLGLAGGPLILGIALSRLGHIRGLVWHMPLPANLAIRELGITLFLAAVGLTAGEQFFATVFTKSGLVWLVCATLIAMLPLLLVGAFARGVLKLNFVMLSGLIAGSTTDPPALAFAGLLAQSDAPHVAYATVYPLTMLLRIVTAQALVMLLCG